MLNNKTAGNINTCDGLRCNEAHGRLKYITHIMIKEEDIVHFHG